MNAHDVARADRVGQYFIWAMAVLSLIAGGLFLRNVVSDIRRPAPFAYSKNVYYPLNTPVCPGDTLRWRSEFVINDAPAVLRVARNLYDVDEQKVVTFDQNPNWLNWMAEDIGKTFTFEGSYPIPANLDPGMYELRTSAGSNISTVDAYRVPFVIPETCFTKGAKK